MPFNPMQSFLEGDRVRQEFAKSSAQRNLAGAAGQQGFNPNFSPEMQQIAALSNDPGAAFAKLDKRRQQSFFDDASKGLKLAKGNKWDKVRSMAQRRAERIQKIGGDPSDAMQIISAIDNQDFAGAQQLLQMGVDAGIQTGYLNPPASIKRASKQKAEGGLVFDPNTGTYSIDEIAKARFDELAQKKAVGKLGIKEKQSINKDISGFIKNAVDIKTTANDLVRLKNLGTGASSIAAIFKFMKANDPTSTVREGEFATAENSGGVPAAIWNFYNKIMTGERIEDKEVQQFVEVAKTLSNSAIESSNNVVKGYLNTFGEDLGGKFPTAIMKRIPTTFDIDNAGSSKNITVDY